MALFQQGLDDTIVALSTPQGVGAIHVIRLSGTEAISITDRFFAKDLSAVASHTLHYGVLSDENKSPVDEVVVGLFRTPTSYTKENIIEISCHGSPYIAQKIIELMIRGGARMARQGEFTLRAFLNGQMDLSQAEAVADLIASNSDGAHELAMQQMRGGFSDEIRHLRQELIDFAALIELELDFGEEDVEFADRGRLRGLIEKIQGVLRSLLDSFALGNVIKHGVSTVIAGRPNAGKSTLLNALLNEERAIVSDIAGTTRDTIEEVLNIEGIEFRLIDTAGIREATDQIEAIGVQKTYEKIEQSTLVVYVFDVIETSAAELHQDVQALSGKGLKSEQLLIIANKMDLNPYTKPSEYYLDDTITAENFITASAVNSMNIEPIKQSLRKTVLQGEVTKDQTIVSNSRHYEALHNSFEALTEVLTSLDNRVTGDLMAMDIRRSLNFLGEITGEISTDDLLDSIFTRFCIGK